MSRTYRRRNARYNLDWVLRDYSWINGFIQQIGLDPHGRELVGELEEIAHPDPDEPVAGAVVANA